MATKTEFHKEKRDPQIQWYMTSGGKRWRTRFRMTKDGRYLLLERRGFTSYDEARKAKAKLISDVEDDYVSGTNKFTVRKYWKLFSDTKLKTGKWRASTLCGQNSQFRTHIEPYWGDIPIDKITRLAVQQWIIKESKEFNLKKSSADKIISVMAGMFEDTVVNDVIKKSPIQKITVTGNEARDASMSFAEYKTAVDFTFHTDLLTPSERAGAILAFYGLRGAEI